MCFVEFITFNHCIYHITNLIKNYCRFIQNFSNHFQNSCLCGMLCTKSLPIMLALCSMLLPSYYAPNYAGIIGSGLPDSISCIGWSFCMCNQHDVHEIPYIVELRNKDNCILSLPGDCHQTLLLGSGYARL